MMKFCPGCGAKILTENAKFCMECGMSFKDIPKEIKQTDELLHNDFFTEAVHDEIDNNGTEFFSDMSDAVKKENDINDELIRDASKCFIRGDIFRAANILLDLSDKSDVRVRHMLGLIHEIGSEDIEIDKNKALDYMFPNGDEDVKGILALHFFTEYYIYKGVDDEYRKLCAQIKCELPKIEADCQSEYEQYELGMLYISESEFKNIKKGKAYLEKSANQGMGISAFMLGWGYENGKFGGVDYKQAIDWYKKAARKGIVFAAEKLGDIYYWGKGGEENIAEAKKWYLIGAKQNKPLCVHQVGIMLELEGNFREAINWLEKVYSYRRS